MLGVGREKLFDIDMLQGINGGRGLRMLGTLERELSRIRKHWHLTRREPESPSVSLAVMLSSGKFTCINDASVQGRAASSPASNDVPSVHHRPQHRPHRLRRSVSTPSH